ncbi:GAF domain-containing protein [Thalassospira sp. MA62]|nr:GAF domain-containing protein [Thalassospira sp. MA62]
MQNIAPLVQKLLDPAMTENQRHDLCATAIENGLYSAMRYHPDTVEVERIASTMPDVYPIAGRKPKKDTDWGRKVLTDQHINVGSGPDDIRWAFSDHETILGLGLDQVLNVPVIRGETVIGTINFLRAEKPFTQQEQTLARLLATCLALRAD